ncbi:carbohydrate-binding domain-containing protein [Luteimicrobium xylanilyticum]|uniref:Carbohydrate-binding domain-containing protein n=1 Tax=Luteimicrobium xylanilyticum TaxID=1133546 RepID=A0A5P9Q5K0_9MICO|nr:carbohydrate-binding domain-containing protein [Luteimicrobium xylanilyticum]QFU96667.1 Carbohydrate-binding domain-containing protein [Luteimicrobium xylanilyticum]
MRRTLVRIALPTTVLAALLAGCSGGDDESGSDPTSTASAQEVLEKVRQVTADSVMAENTAAHESDTTASSDATTITLSGTSATVDGDGATADGSTVTITAAGTYRISGTLTDGKVVVDTSGADGTVNLVLDGADLTSSTTSPLQVLDADDVVVTLAKGTTNHLADTTSYADDDDASGALFSKADLTITGAGKLTVDGNANDGIVSKDGLVIASGDITVNSVDDGIRGKDYLVVQGGTLVVDAKGDALKSDDDEDAKLGYVQVTGGTLTLTAGDDGLTATTDVVVTGGDLTVVTDGGHTTKVGEDESPKGLVADANIVVGGGTLSVDAADDAVHSDGVVAVTDGDLTIQAGDDAVHADSALAVSGGTIDVKTAYEGLEAAVISVSGGSTTLVTSDDGVNGSSGSSSTSEAAGGGGEPPQGGEMPTDLPEGGPESGEMPTGMPDGGPQDGEMPEGGGGPQGGGGGGEEADDSVLIDITGGTLVVDADGDGLDSNGNMTMSGGTVVVSGPTNDGNGSLDYNGTFTVSGGELIAVGSSGMAQTPSDTSTQSFVGLTADAAQKAGTVVHVVDGDGKVVASFTASKDFSSVVYSSSDVTKGDTYTLVAGGKAGTKVAGGLSHGGDASGGTKIATGTAGEATSGMGGPGGMGGGPGGQQGSGEGQSDS